MASSNSTKPTPARSDREPLRAFSMDSLIRMIDSCADEINEKACQVAAIAYCGASHAGHIVDGEEIDCTSKHMFNTITDLTESAFTHLTLKDAIAELRLRHRSQAPGKQAQ